MSVIDLAYELFCKADEAEDNGHLDTAVRLFTLAARMDYQIAQSRLATLYDDRIKPPQPLKAIYWYVRAYRNGDDTAAWNLAMHFVRRQNHRWYRFWMQKAVEGGNLDAMKEMEKIFQDSNYMTRLPLEDL